MCEQTASLSSFTNSILGGTEVKVILNFGEAWLRDLLYILKNLRETAP